MHTLKVGLIGAGANTKLRHIPGLRAVPHVDIVAVCNRRPESTLAVAKEYGIPRMCTSWQQVVDSPDVDAVVIGTWPYLHCPITLAALEMGKHVLTEARMAMNLKEARQMADAARRHPEKVTQIVPSPFGLKGHKIMQELIESDYIGELRELHLSGMGDGLADPAVPLGWRQDASLSGYNMLMLGILHETLMRWVPPVRRVMAQVHAFIPSRIDPAGGVRRPVGTPDSVQVLTVHKGGARGIYQFSGVAHGSPGMSVRLYGSNGTLEYDFETDRILGKRRSDDDYVDIPIPDDKSMEWRVEAEFVEAIRDRRPIEFTDFATGVKYMEFTEAVARSAQNGEALDLPLEDD